MDVHGARAGWAAAIAAAAGDDWTAHTVDVGTVNPPAVVCTGPVVMRTHTDYDTGVELTLAVELRVSRADLARASRQLDDALTAIQTLARPVRLTGPYRTVDDGEAVLLVAAVELDL